MKRLAMRKIRDALRLQEQELSPGRIGESLGIGRTTIQEYLSRVRAAGLSWPLPEGLADPELEERLYPRAVPGFSRGHSHNRTGGICTVSCVGKA